MKRNAVLSFVLSILEGGLAGACFYQAEQEKETKSKVLWHIISAGWFVLSVLDGMEGARRLRKSEETAPEEEFL